VPAIRQISVFWEQAPTKAIFADIHVGMCPTR